jgi:hypothetical protein
LEIPLNQWLQIVVYREFFDFPRYILAKDVESNYWILDSDFDYELDNYDPDFCIFSAGSDLAFAEKTYESQAKDRKLEPLLRVPVKSVQFDPTLRKECFLMA